MPYCALFWPVTTLPSAVQIWEPMDMSVPGGGAGTCSGISGDQSSGFT